MNIITWRCNVCLGEFAELDGAFCYRCKKPTCCIHLNLINYKEKDGQAKIEQIVCDKCLKEDEKFIKFERRFLSKSSWARIFGS